MIRSMTAFARRETRGEFGELSWEIRSVNQRFLEPNLRLADELRALEPLVRERLQARLGRGKLDCSLRFKPAAATGTALAVNDRLVEQLLAAAERMSHRLHSSHAPSIMDVLRWPGVLQTEEPDLGPMQGVAMDLLEQTLDDLIVAREREGGRLAELISDRLDAMREQVARARVRMPLVVAALRDRLRARLAEISENFDNERIEQEMALLAQRLDVDEEMDRLTTHLDEVQRVLGNNEPVGRRLDFLMQELNREANTLGSKSADTETTGISVEMKVLIEQMREQVQNLE